MKTLVDTTASSMIGDIAYKVEIEIDHNHYIIDLASGGARLTKGESSSLVSIPANVLYGGQTFPLTSISACAFADNDSIEEVMIIGNNLCIEYRAFYNCQNLRKVEINGIVSRIDDSAFYNCKKLDYVEILGEVKTIGSEAFALCDNLKYFSFSQKVYNLGRGVFRGCYSIKKIAIPESITKLPDITFWGCSSLEEVVLPCSIKEIGKQAFLDCESLERIEYDKGVIIGRGCFDRTPLDPAWEETHPITPSEKQRYKYLDEIKYNLRSGRILCESRSLYDSNGMILKGDDLFSVIKDFTDGTSIHYEISNTLITTEGLKGKEFDSNRTVYFYPTGKVFRRVICDGGKSAHFIRMVENGNPLGKSIRRILLNEGVREIFLDNPEMWMEDFLEQNPDIPSIIADSLKGLGFNVGEEEIRDIAMKQIHTDNSWSDYEKNYWDNNFLGRIVNCINSMYLLVDKLYKSSGTLSGRVFYRKSIANYVYLVNMIKYQIVSHRILKD